MHTIMHTMASKYERPRSPFWWINYRDKNGKIRREATEFRIGIGVETRACERRVALLTLQEADSLVVQRSDHAFSAWVPAFLRVNYANSPKTLTKYSGSWQIISTFLAARHVLAPLHVQRGHATEYMEWRTAQKLQGLKGKKTVCRNSALLDLTIFRVIMYEALKRGFIQTNPISKLRFKKDKAREKPELTGEQIQTVRAALLKKPAWMRVSFEIAIHQGCRFSETCLPLSQVNLADNQITFKIKGGRNHTTKLHPALRPLFAAMIERGQAATFSMPERNSTRDWSRLFKRLKMPGVSFHCTRVTVITQLARAGVNEQQAMAYIGHAGEAVHRIYQRLGANDLSACVQAILVPASRENQDALAASRERA